MGEGGEGGERVRSRCALALSAVLSLLILAASAQAAAPPTLTPCPQQSPAFIQFATLPQCVTDLETTHLLAPGWKVSADITVDRMDFISQWLRDGIEEATGIDLPVITPASGNPSQRIVIGLTSEAHVAGQIAQSGLSYPPELGDQGYVLDTSSETWLIAAESARGVFYGVQTFLDMLGSDPEVRALRVTDYPDTELRAAWVTHVRSPLRLDGSDASMPLVFGDSHRAAIDGLARMKINMLGHMDKRGDAFHSDAFYQPYADMAAYCKD